jgi:hypothetical protein
MIRRDLDNDRHSANWTESFTIEYAGVFCASAGVLSKAQRGWIMQMMKFS